MPLFRGGGRRILRGLTVTIHRIRGAPPWKAWTRRKNRRRNRPRRWRKRRPKSATRRRRRVSRPL